jgi:hypothetical protein
MDDHFHGAPIIGLPFKIVFHGDAVKLVVFVGVNHSGASSKLSGLNLGTLAPLSSGFGKGGNGQFI